MTPMSRSMDESDKYVFYGDSSSKLSVRFAVVHLPNGASYSQAYTRDVSTPLPLMITSSFQFTLDIPAPKEVARIADVATGLGYFSRTLCFTHCCID